MQIPHSISTSISRKQNVRRRNSLRTAAMRALIAGLAIMASCSTPSEQLPTWLIITPMKASYKIGDTLRVSLDNSSGSSIGYSLCGVALQKQFGPNWTEIRLSEIDIACGDTQLVLRANEHIDNLVVHIARTYGPLPASLSTGNYRIRIPSAVLKDTDEKLEGLNLLSAPFALTTP